MLTPNITGYAIQEKNTWQNEKRDTLTTMINSRNDNHYIQNVMKLINFVKRIC